MEPSVLTQKGWSKWLHAEDKISLFELLSDIKSVGFKSPERILDISTNATVMTIKVAPIIDQAFNCGFFITFPISESPELKPSDSISKKEVMIPISYGNINQTREIVLESIERNVNEKEIVRDDAKTEEYIADLKASNYLKDKILAIVSHDLRSPIASLKGLSSNFFDQELTDEERTMVRESLISQLDEVSDLTENLLRWASLSFLKKNSQENEILNLFEVVEQNVKLNSGHSQSKNIRVSNEMEGALWTRVNKDHIQIVVRNLLTNAIKYTPFNGSVDISGVDLKTHVQLRIVDTGIGFTSEQLAKLFTYTHTNTYGTNGEKGIGLGLLLCREYIESNGGKIFISSEINVGTTVIVELPSVDSSQSIQKESIDN